jgi:hypothetical protein
MKITIGAYALCDGTYPGGVALSAPRIQGDRKTDVFLSIGQPIPHAFDRTGRVATYSFEVERAHDDIDDAEQFILDHESNIPSVGDVTVTNEAGSPSSYVIPNGKLLRHELLLHEGKHTVHSYTIAGGQPASP